MRYEYREVNMENSKSKWVNEWRQNWVKYWKQRNKWKRMGEWIYEEEK